MSDYVTPQMALELLRQHVRQPGRGGQREFAAKLGVSEAMVSQVLNGHRSPTSSMLNAVGLSRTAAYTASDGEEVLAPLKQALFDEAANLIRRAQQLGMTRDELFPLK